MKRLILALAFSLAYIAAPSAQPLDVVREARAKYGPLLEPTDAPAFLRDVAIGLARLKGGSWGLLVKTSGNHCGGYSCDVVCDGERVYDVLFDGPDAGDNPKRPGRAEPNWPGDKPNDLLNGRTCDFVIMAVPKPPDGGTFDPGPIYQRLDALTARVTDLESLKVEIEALRRVDAEHAARIEHLEARPLPVMEIPCWTVSTSRDAWHAHKVTIGNCGGK